MGVVFDDELLEEAVDSFAGGEMRFDAALEAGEEGEVAVGGLVHLGGDGGALEERGGVVGVDVVEGDLPGE